MIVIELRFLTGKWHATPWARQVNEGAVEWPPSPWRLLRALLAAWHQKCHDATEEEVRKLIERLTPPPSFHLPRASHGHTRHYMPAENDKPSKIFDAFIAIDSNQPVVACWPEVTLTESQRRLLERLLSGLTYFGRAESWVEARLADDCRKPLNAVPIDSRSQVSGDELVPLLAPTSPAEYDVWKVATLDNLRDRRLQEKQAAAVRKGKPPEKEKLLKADLAKLDAAVPSTLFAALHAETGELRSTGWNRPPGSQWVQYLRPANAFSADATYSLRRPLKELPTVARYAVAGAVRPQLTEALWIGERLRKCLMSRSDAAPVFSGKTLDGKPASGGHQHAHYLSECYEPDRWITHITVYAHQGFEDAQQRALKRLEKMWGTEKHDLQLVLLGIGVPADFGGFLSTSGESPLLATAKVWESRTPFVPADQLRHRYRIELEGDRQRCMKDLTRIVRTEMLRRVWLKDYARLLESVDLIPRGPRIGGTTTAWLKFRRERQSGGGVRHHSTPFGLRLQFSQPVTGPIALGYGSHFGLGLFAAMPLTTCGRSQAHPPGL